MKVKIEDLRGIKVGIFGFGVEGRSLAGYLAGRSLSQVVVFDEKTITGSEVARLKKEGVKFHFGDFAKVPTDGVGVAVRSPSVSREKIKAVLRGVPITTLTNLFANSVSGRLIGVTGTKGKGTTVLLIKAALEEAGREVLSAGNIGSFPLSALDRENPDRFIIFEASSFQLTDLSAAVDFAVVLPIFPDHLDWHESFADYIKAKSRLAASIKRGGALICADQKWALASCRAWKGERFIFSTKAKISKNGCVIAGRDALCRDGARELRVNDLAGAGRGAQVPPVDLLAACSLAFALKIDFDVEKILKRFSKLPFRLEKEGCFGGLTFYNDSASTNPISAIEAIGMMEEKFCLVMGGSGKGIGFDDLAEAIGKSSLVAKIYLFGQNAEEIARALEEKGLSDFKILSNIDQVMDEIRAGERGFKAVLFSPASASFDQFKNYCERGAYFSRKVRDIFSG